MHFPASPAKVVVALVKVSLNAHHGSRHYMEDPSDDLGCPFPNSLHDRRHVTTSASASLGNAMKSIRRASEDMITALYTCLQLSNPQFDDASDNGANSALCGFCLHLISVVAPPGLVSI